MRLILKDEAFINKSLKTLQENVINIMVNKIKIELLKLILLFNINFSEKY